MAKEECDCLFCNSKCPECGSEAIHVTFQPSYEYDNDTEDRIFVFSTEDSIKVGCGGCGGTFGEHETEQRLHPLIRALRKYLDLPGNKSFRHKHGGSIKGVQYISAKEKGKGVN